MQIRTDRLLVTEFSLTMAEDIHKNSLDEDTRRFVPDEVFETTEEAEETLRFLIGCYSSESGPFVYPLLKDGTCIGYVQAVSMGDGEWEVGYHIGRHYRNQGYASEALQAFLPVILPALKIDHIKGICLSENIPSIRVLEKCGFRKIYEGQGNYQGAQRNIVEFRCNL